MDIIIQSLGFKSGNTLETFIKEKVNDLKSDYIVRAHVTLFMGAENEPQNNYCEIRLEVPGNDHFVKKHSHYFETSVTDCINVLAQMINKNKDINVEKRQANAADVQDAMITNNDEDDDVLLQDFIK